MVDQSSPDLFHSPDASKAPTQLSTDSVQAMVLASAAAYPAIQSSLTAIKDTPIPDTEESHKLIRLADRMKGIEATQMAQSIQMAELRGRSENVVRAWYEQGVLRNSDTLADLEGRIEAVERGVRRREREKESEDQP